jgi:glycosyltransferase involved in cell wall biosynthesis
MNKKILFFCTHAHPYRGGLEKNVLELASRLAVRNYETGLCCFNSEKVLEKEQLRSVDFVRLPAFSILGGAYSLPYIGGRFWTLLRELGRNKPDVVITQTRFFFSTFIGFLFAKFYGIPLIHTERGTTFVQHANPLVGLIAWLVDITWGRFLFMFAAKITGVSGRAVGFAEGLGAKNGVVIHNGIELRADPFIARKKTVIAFAGRIVSGKGIFVMLEALDLIDEGHLTDVEIRFYGHGAAYDELKSKIDTYGFSKNVKVMGEIDSESLRDSLREVSIFVNPSFSEGLPTSVLEAAEAGCAIVATDVGGTDEIIKNEVSGLIVPPYDKHNLAKAIEKLLMDRVLRNAYGEEAQRFVRAEFSWSRVVDKYTQLIESL